ncbi:hypothetical protein CAP35_07335 [Chitinophagaceae bacterium IBVUCB1]|nr:hypothetical protein CAP35_07335 [Chitinophagaceae bacterium IBVUCB1]
MMNIKKIVLALSVLCIASDADAQLHRLNKRIEYNNQKEKGRYPLWQRISLGYGRHFMFDKAEFTYRSVTNQFFSTSASLRTSGSMALSLDAYFPVARFSKRSCFAISAGVSYINAMLTHDTVFVGPTVLQKDLETAFISVPIGIDFKMGGDAVQSKEYKTMFTAGVGILPTYIQSTGFESEGSKSIDQETKILSYLKVEAGFFAGIAFKLRGMAYFGNLILADRQETIIKEGTQDQILGYRRTTSSGPMGYTISLIIMPGSAGWRR